MQKRILAVVLCVITTLILSASSKPAKKVTIYITDADADYLIEKMMDGENTVEYLMECLVKNNMIPQDTKVNEYRIAKEAGKRVLHLDLSRQFGEAAAQTGTAGEFLYIYSVVNTMIRNQEVDAVYLTAEGQIIETGHAIYDEPLTFSEHVIPLER